jgi:hypothetical protein
VVRASLLLAAAASAAAAAAAITRCCQLLLHTLFERNRCIYLLLRLLLLLQFKAADKNNENYNEHGQLVYTSPSGHMECENDKCRATELCKVRLQLCDQLAAARQCMRLFIYKESHGG